MPNRFDVFVVTCAFNMVFGCGAAEPVSGVQPAPDIAVPDVEPVEAQPAPSPSDGRVVSTRVEDPRAEPKRAKELKTSMAVEVGTNNAINPTTSFRRGTKRVIASFYVSGIRPGGTIRVLWYRDGNLIDEIDIESEGDKRYTDTLAKPKGLSGDYSVEVELEGEVFAGRSFIVGADDVGPAIDRVVLGTGVAKNGMPKREKTVFKSDAHAIGCGVRLIGLSVDSKIQLQWVALTQDGEEILHTCETEIKKGKKARAGITWEPDGDLKPGPYKAVISLGGRKIEELAFSVE